MRNLFLDLSNCGAREFSRMKSTLLNSVHQFGYRLLQQIFQRQFFWLYQFFQSVTCLRNQSIAKDYTSGFEKNSINNNDASQAETKRDKIIFKSWWFEKSWPNRCYVHEKVSQSNFVQFCWNCFKKRLKINFVIFRQSNRIGALLLIDCYSHYLFGQTLPSKKKKDIESACNKLLRQSKGFAVIQADGIFVEQVQS